MDTDKNLNKKQRVIKSICLVVIFACAISIYHTTCSGGPKPSKLPIYEAGQMVADETLKLIGRKGNVVVIAMDNSYSKPQLKAFRQTIEKQPGAEVTAVEYVAAGELAKGAMGSALSSETFLRLIQKHRNAAAIVSLVGPPVLSDQEIDKLDAKIPKVVVFAPMGFGIRKLLEEQVVQVAIIPRITPPMAPVTPGNTSTAAPPQGAGRSYEVVTTETIQSRPVFEPPPVPVPKAK